MQNHNQNLPFKVGKIHLLVFISTLFVTIITFGQASSQPSNHLKAKCIYIPEHYKLNQIDTTIHDSIQLSVKHYTLMDSYATAYGVTDSVEKRYRDYAIEVTIKIKGNVVINKKLLKADFTEDEKYWPNLTLFRVWLNPEDINNDRLKLRVGMGIPNFSTPVIASLILNYSGAINIKLKE